MNPFTDTNTLWKTADGVIDADTMQEWFVPFNSTSKDEYIRKTILRASALLVGKTTYEMLASYCTGSAALVQSLMKENLIDEFHLLVHLIIIGSGKHFFKDGMKTSGMKNVKTEKFDKGVVLLSYQIVN